MGISKQTIDQIYQATDIVEVVGDFVTLKRKGKDFAALSPFTNEKSPSFYVSPAKQIFKCFSTGKGGTAISFLMEIDRLTYVEALKYLANKYNIELVYDEFKRTDQEKEAQTDRDSLYIVLNYAKNVYHDYLNEHEIGKTIGLSYFNERGLNAKTIKDFELGYCPDSWDFLLNQALKAQYNQETLEKAGLIKITEHGKKFDFFRNRVMFPIHNASGKVVALAGRILNNEKGTAKYINSPETDVYHKSDILYGLFQSKNEIRNKDICYLVEGYMDVISLYQAGITNVVASSGTSLTENQVKLLARYSKNITILFDGDNAGIKAAMRGTDILLESGLNIKIVLFPDGDDPDSYVKKVGSEVFFKYVQTNSKDFITFKTEILLKDSENDPLKKAQVIHEIVESITKLPDSIQRAIYFKKCSSLMDIDEHVIISEYNKILIKKSKEKSIEKPIQNNPNDLPPADFFLSEENQNPEPIIDLFPNKINPIYIQEMEIVRLLISYGEQEIDEQQKLAQYIINSIQDLEIKNDKLKRIIDIYKTEFEKGEWPNLGYFVSSDHDKDLEVEITNIIADKYELSPLWKDKFNILIDKKDANLLSATEITIMRLQWRNLQVMIKENLKEISKYLPDNEIDIDLGLMIHQQLKESEKKIATILKITISG